MLTLVFHAPQSFATASETSESLTAQQIYQQSVNLFTFKELAFEVQSNTSYGNTVAEQRRFLVASKHNQPDSSLLIRFLQPKEIQCTSILMNKSADSLSRYVYFPALNRIKRVPDSDKQKEMMGMGISYAEIDKPEGQFLPLEELELDGRVVYKVTLNDGQKSMQAWVEKATMNLIKLEKFENNKLLKTMMVNATKKIYQQKMITDWNIQDFELDRQIHYQVIENTIQVQVDRNLFRKNLLKRCR